MHIPTLPSDHVAVFAEAEAVVQSYLASSSYHFVPHGIFDYVKRVNELAGIRVETFAGGKRGSGKRSTATAGGATISVATAGPPGEAKRVRLDAPSSETTGGTGMMGLQED